MRGPGDAGVRGARLARERGRGTRLAPLAGPGGRFGPAHHPEDGTVRERLARFDLPSAALLAVLGGLAALAGHPGLGIAAGGLALGVGLLGLHLRLTVIEERLGSAVRAGQRAGETSGRALALAERQAEAQRRQRARLRRDLEGLRRHLDTLPGDTAYLHRLVAGVADPATPLPLLGGWAVTARTVLVVVEEIQRAPGPVTIVDCGSGSSTVLEALTLAARGAGGHVYALESDPAFAEQTRGYLRAHGAEDHGVVIDAPLVDVTLPDGVTTPWYDLSGLPDIGEIDILLVDGPIGTLADQARFPAFPLLADRLADGALVVLDDTNRTDEKQIVRRWAEADYSGRRLRPVGTQGRCTLLRVVREAP